MLILLFVLIGWRAYEIGLDEGYREYQKGLLVKLGVPLVVPPPAQIGGGFQPLPISQLDFTLFCGDFFEGDW